MAHSNFTGIIMSLFLFLTVVQAVVAAALVGVILMQRSEGGGLGIGGGSPGGLMGARGAADFLTRSTRWLAIAFVALSITLAAVAVGTVGGDEITTTIDRSVVSADPLAPAADPLAPVQEAPASDDPLSDVAE
ncbi:preprotein translocase subunit SecG [Altererythrobacter rubellus]|jgi:preprotein translocase subunit SecG|uniref:Protein-export membrane protein SecG n=1 Tax=Altererythrobacter rubellus TaxID=2173831 RepID=A0A9Y2B6P4_9SPHN|nr:preprotein translocase subunit SecG [Altererythrobacter rubellus]WIW94814.1 preprotein translocase subunit SecG [Altererythrobacter rubellus]